MFINNTFFSSNVTGFAFDSNCSTNGLQKQKQSKTFSDMINESLIKLSDADNNVAQMKQDYADGKRDDIQNVLIEGEKFNLQMSYALQVRNKLVEAFQEISRMQI